MTEKKQFVPGITVSSVGAALLGLLLTGIFTQYFDIIVGLSFASEHTLALPAIWSFLIILIMCGLAFLFTRLRLLTRAEGICVLYIMLIASPLMTQGFWHRVVAVIATNPKMADFEKMDAFNDRLWPHGPNLLKGALDVANRDALSFSGAHGWETIEYEEGETADLPVLSNTKKDEVSTVRIRLPIARDGKPFIVRGEPYMISVLVRADDLGPGAGYRCRVYHDDEERFTEFFASSAGPKVSFLHRRGFQRVGAYGVKFSPEADESVTLEFSLSGAGRLALCEPKLFSVAALEGIYKGKKVVRQSEFDALPPAQRANLLVKPDTMWSLAGIRFLLAGYIPVRDWAGTLFTWTSFVVLLLLGTLAINIIMRRQWLENERFVMPVAKIPEALADIGLRGGDGSRSIWTNRLMWTGFVVTVLCMLWRAWNFYNPEVPLPGLLKRTELAPYFSDPGWGGMWSRVRFEIVPIFLAMCMFMELNVLMSIVVGYFVFRSQSWVGEMTGMTSDPNFPYAHHQAIAAFVAYGLIVLFFTRKYLGRVVGAAIRGDRELSQGEAMSYRWALITLLLTLAGSVAWAHWLGITKSGMLIFFVFLLLVGFVCTKIRTECGAPWGYFAPYNLALFMALFGGIGAFGPEAMLFCYVASFMLAPTVFFLIPGAQMELLEMGKRRRVQPRHLVYAALLGIVGGMVVGGWVFLSNAYALGGETSRYAWAFDTKWWYFFSYNQDMTAATNAYLGQTAAPAAGGGVDPAWVAVGITAAVTVVLTVLRQVFAGFWFHPVGFVLGSSNFMDYVWGSALTAWLVRTIVLRIGGAATVKNKLQPIFIGVFLGAALSYLLIGVHAAFLQAQGIDKIYPVLRP